MLNKKTRRSRKFPTVTIRAKLNREERRMITWQLTGHNPLLVSPAPHIVCVNFLKKNWRQFDILMNDFVGSKAALLEDDPQALEYR